MSAVARSPSNLAQRDHGTEPEIRIGLDEESGERLNRVRTEAGEPAPVLEPEREPGTPPIRTRMNTPYGREGRRHPPVRPARAVPAPPQVRGWLPPRPLREPGLRLSGRRRGDRRGGRRATTSHPSWQAPQGMRPPPRGAPDPDRGVPLQGRARPDRGAWQRGRRPRPDARPGSRHRAGRRDPRATARRWQPRVRPRQHVSRCRRLPAARPGAHPRRQAMRGGGGPEGRPPPRGRPGRILRGLARGPGGPRCREQEGSRLPRVGCRRSRRRGRGRAGGPRQGPAGRGRPTARSRSSSATLSSSFAGDQPRLPSAVAAANRTVWERSARAARRPGMAPGSASTPSAPAAASRTSCSGSRPRRRRSGRTAPESSHRPRVRAAASRTSDCGSPRASMRSGTAAGPIPATDSQSSSAAWKAKASRAV